MKRAVLEKNLKNMIEHQKKLAREGENFDAGTIIDCERLLNNIPTNEELKRINDCRDIRGQLQIHNMQSVTDIKNKYGLSWSDMLLYGRLEVR